MVGPDCKPNVLQLLRSPYVGSLSASGCGSPDVTVKRPVKRAARAAASDRVRRRWIHQAPALDPPARVAPDPAASRPGCNMSRWLRIGPRVDPPWSAAKACSARTHSQLFSWPWTCTGRLLRTRSRRRLGRMRGPDGEVRGRLPHCSGRTAVVLALDRPRVAGARRTATSQSTAIGATGA